MTLNTLATIMIVGFVILVIMNFMLNLRISSIFFHLDNKIDTKIDRLARELRENDDKNFLFLSEKIDAINVRFDALYRDLFNKKAA